MCRMTVSERLSPRSATIESGNDEPDRGVIRTDMRPEDLTPPPDLTGKSIRFSDDFHPLDHRFGDRRCRQLQRRLRGPYLHAKLQWQYGPAGDRVRTPLHRYTTCVIGQHHYATAWRRHETEWVFLHRRCAWCHRDDPDLITHERID